MPASATWSGVVTPLENSEIHFDLSEQMRFSALPRHSLVIKQCQWLRSYFESIVWFKLRLGFNVGWNVVENGVLGADSSLIFIKVAFTASHSSHYLVVYTQFSCTVFQCNGFHASCSLFMCFVAVDAIICDNSWANGHEGTRLNGSANINIFNKSRRIQFL